MKIEFLSLMGKYLMRRYSDGIDADERKRLSYTRRSH